MARMADLAIADGTVKARPVIVGVERMMTSSAPSATKRRPIAAPSPEPPPVTSILFPASSPFSNIGQTLLASGRYANRIRLWPGFKSGMKHQHQTVRPKNGYVHESHSLLAILRPRRSRAGGST